MILFTKDNQGTCFFKLTSDRSVCVSRSIKSVGPIFHRNVSIVFICAQELAQIEACMIDMYFLLFKEKIIFEGYQNIKLQSPNKKCSRYLWNNSFCTWLSPLFQQHKCVPAPKKHSMYIIFLWNQTIQGILKGEV